MSWKVTISLQFPVFYIVKIRHATIYHTVAYGCIWFGIAKRHHMNLYIYNGLKSKNERKYAKCYFLITLNVQHAWVVVYFIFELWWIATMAWTYHSQNNCVKLSSFFTLCYTISMFPYLMPIFRFHGLQIVHKMFFIFCSFLWRLFTGTSSHIIYLTASILLMQNSWCVSFKVSACWLKSWENKATFSCSRSLSHSLSLSHSFTFNAKWKRVNCSLFSVNRFE